MDGALASAFPGPGYPEMDAGHAAVLNTNTDPSNLATGLKSNHDFTVEAVFDLTIPDQDREGYGIQLTDAFGQLGDDRAVIAVRRTGEEVHVRFGQNDAVADTRMLVGQHLLELPGLKLPAGIALDREQAGLRVEVAGADGQRSVYRGQLQPISGRSERWMLVLSAAAARP